MLYAAWVSRAEFAHGVHAIAYVADLLLVQTWSVRMVNFFNVPAWTISVEAFFYLVFPFVLLKLKPKTRGQAAGAIAVFWVAALAAPLYALNHYPGPAWRESITDTSYGAGFVFRLRRLPLVMLPEFFAGISLGWWYLKFKPSVRTGAVLAWTGLVGTLVILFFGDHVPFIFFHNGVLIPVFAALLMGLCQDNVLTRVLSTPALVLLGEASFALYLFHFLINQEPVFGKALDFRAAVIKLAVVIPLSIALHLYVERPGRRMILDWWRERHPG